MAMCDFPRKILLYQRVTFLISSLFLARKKRFASLEGTLFGFGGTQQLFFENKIGTKLWKKMFLHLRQASVMGNCGCFFPRATTLISAGKSHSSGVHGLVFQSTGFVFELVRMREFFYKHSKAEGPPFPLFLAL